MRLPLAIDDPLSVPPVLAPSVTTALLPRFKAVVEDIPKVAAVVKVEREEAVIVLVPVSEKMVAPRLIVPSTLLSMVSLF